MKRLLYIIIVAIAASAIFSSCGTQKKIITPAEVTHDTIYQQRLIFDSVYVHDSIYRETYIKGDTVIQYRYIDHIEYRDRFQHDSIYIDRTDTLRVVVKEEVNHLTRWQDFRIVLGDILMTVIFIYIGYLIFDFLKKKG